MPVLTETAAAVTGVRVHFNDQRAPVLHARGTHYRVDDDTGVLYVMGVSGRVAVHASMEWAWAETVYAEPVPEPAKPKTVTFTDSGPVTFMGASLWDAAGPSTYVRLVSAAPEPEKSPLQIARDELAAAEESRDTTRQGLRSAEVDVELARAKVRVAELQNKRDDDGKSAA